MLKVFCAGSRMALGSLLTMSILISACAGLDRDYYGRLSATSKYNSTESPIGIFLNMTKDNAYSVPKKDRDKHEQCVYFSLDNLFMGEKCDWYSQDGSTHGSVKVISQRQQGSGSCTTLFNSVFHKGERVIWRDTACRSLGSQWKFVKR